MRNVSCDKKRNVTLLLWTTSFQYPLDIAPTNVIDTSLLVPHFKIVNAKNPKKQQLSTKETLLWLPRVLS